jgi:hypothetical protein
MKAGVVLIAGRNVKIEKHFRDGPHEYQASLMYFGSHAVKFAYFHRVCLNMSCPVLTKFGAWTVRVKPDAYPDENSRQTPETASGLDEKFPGRALVPG